ncbi:Lrp/AsnC family transcriptional regulator [Streptomyces coffeae]|uniref:Lrp/AsnC family transcriptional regulator n=1 Tax=Streptomyces coffeae TaxID=621382 RepID=A0ABS1N8B6_9ACTN|nr:Lrp/AsnC family transcriptional regulator [Streptomyces coffeae]MBL1096320.1 Lrp/AsnC family transcriptional regulator [Streptomyces coffeae]
MESDSIDDLDRALVYALQLDGRAPFSRIAEVLGVSDQTVARRYTRLRTTRTIRVLGLTDPAALGELVWLVRVQCMPDTAEAVAEALARREDTSWVSLMSEGTEVVALTRAATEADSDTLLLRKLPQTPRVVGVSAHCVLHEFYGGPQGLITKSGALTDEQAERLRLPEPDRSRGPRGPLAADDRTMLKVLAQDGRAPLAQLAAATGWSQSTVRRRLADLRADGTLYFDVDYDHRAFRTGIVTALWLSVPPSELEATGRALADHPEVAFASATTGPNNLLAIVVCADAPAFYRYLTTRIAALPAIRHMESSPMIRRVKGPGPLPVAPRGAARRPA